MDEIDGQANQQQDRHRAQPWLKSDWVFRSDSTRQREAGGAESGGATCSRRRSESSSLAELEQRNRYAALISASLSSAFLRSRGSLPKRSGCQTLTRSRYAFLTSAGVAPESQSQNLQCSGRHEGPPRESISDRPGAPHFPPGLFRPGVTSWPEGSWPRPNSLPKAKRSDPGYGGCPILYPRASIAWVGIDVASHVRGIFVPFSTALS